MLPVGQVVTGGDDRRVLLWDPYAPDVGTIELGRHNGWVLAVTVLPDGRVITGGQDGRVLAWNPAAPGTSPTELGRHHGKVETLAVLPDGRLVTGGAEDERVVVWEPWAKTRIVQLGCSITALTVAPFGLTMSYLVIAHEGTGFSTWSLTM